MERTMLAINDSEFRQIQSMESFTESRQISIEVCCTEWFFQVLMVMVSMNISSLDGSMDESDRTSSANRQLP